MGEYRKFNRVCTCALEFCLCLYIPTWLPKIKYSGAFSKLPKFKPPKISTIMVISIYTTEHVQNIISIYTTEHVQNIISILATDKVYMLLIWE